jgi:phosphoribosylanthranilate isomerase
MKPVYLDRLSLTGADDNTLLLDLANLSTEFSFIEWALLYSPYTEGKQRNPSQRWRQEFFDMQLPGHNAIHLCGDLAFEQLLANQLPAELEYADRMQLNINARKPSFTTSQVLDVYKRAMDISPAVILQYHAGTASVITSFINSLQNVDRGRVHILMDDSRGRGQSPDNWELPEGLEHMFCGFAGGLGPSNIEQAIVTMEAHAVPYWADMETGIRTDNEFDLHKVKQVVQAAAFWAELA